MRRIERGELHLSTLVLLRPHLDEKNVEELAAAVVGKTKRDVEELLARLAPKPDVPSAIVELGTPSTDANATLFADGDASAAPAAPRTPTAPRTRIEPSASRAPRRTRTGRSPRVLSLPDRSRSCRRV